MMIDNFELISELIKTNKEKDCFFHLQIIRRGKDHPDLPAANRTIMQYFIEDEIHLSKRKDEIISLCELFKARAYINLAPKSSIRLAQLANCELSKRIFDNDYKKVHKIFNTAAGKLKSKNPMWVIDIDDPNLLNVILGYFAKNNIDIKAIVPTKSASHIISKPFRLDHFMKDFSYISVHKNNPTILFIPNSI